jgi:hypothetical protein
MNAMKEYEITSTCICGKTNIVDNYVIQNIKTGEELIVGSKCAENWFNTKSIEDGCIFCGRNKKKGGNCINCSGKKNLVSVFSSWKKYASEHKNERQRIERIERMEGKEKVSFGKYKNVLTYSQLCNDIQLCNDYVDWCLNESQMNDMVKERLRYFANKYRDE